MPGTVTVELSDLKGWTAQVGRAADDLDHANRYATGNLADADFGRILETLTSEYASLLPGLHDILLADGAGIGAAQAALGASATTYETTENRSQDRIAALPGGEKLSATDDGTADGFGDRTEPTAALTAPIGAGESLPEVSLGFMFDKVCDLITWAGLRDPREYITQWIAGDIDKASMHVDAWKHLADCVEQVDGNLSAGGAAIERTWTGAAASASAAHLSEWSTCFDSQSGAMRKISAHLDDAIDQAVQLAQVVVDIIRTVVSLLSAALSNAAIPGYGQWKLVKSVKEAWPLINSARKVLSTFWNAITMIKDLIIACAGEFSRAALPSAPSAGVAS